MAIPDSALSPQIVRGFMVAYLDVLDGATPDPIRAALAQADVVIPAGMTGDPAIDGQRFRAVDPTFVDVSPITMSEGGSDTVTIKVSATIAGDSGILNQLASPANFRGRIGKLLIGIQDAGLNVIHHRFHYIGYMTAPEIAFDPDSQLITLSLENYLNIYSGGSPARTLLSQRNYDSGDLSADATAGSVNGTQAAGSDFGGGVNAALAARLAGVRMLA